MQDLLEPLYRLVEKEGIFLHYDDLSSAPGRRIYGLYYRDPHRGPVIILDHRLERSVALHRSVLAEELGHHYTAPSTSVAVPYTSYELSVAISRDERRAIRWACDFLMPVADVARAVEAGIHTPWELAEHFVVTEWLVWRRLEFLAAAAKARRWSRLGGITCCIWALLRVASLAVLPWVA